MGRVTLLDDSTRPKAPPIEGVTEGQRRHGRRLALIHTLYLRELAGLRQVMDEVARGEESASELAEAVSSLQMMSNYRQFGAMCGQGCSMLTMHHTIEDRMMFPVLDHHTAGLSKVVDRLRAEHVVIHELLEELNAAAQAAMDDPGPRTFSELRRTYEVLEPVVASHFGYEQTELQDAIGFYNVEI